MNEKYIFDGWTLEGLTIRHEYFELYFRLWPNFKDQAEMIAYNQMYSDACFRARGIFCQPTRILLSEFISGMVVEETAVSFDGAGSITCRFVLTRGAFIEITARNFQPVRW